jgi:hypothetical protein
LGNETRTTRIEAEWSMVRIQELVPKNMMYLYRRRKKDEETQKKNNFVEGSH